MRSVSLRFLLLAAVTFVTAAAFAHDVTITGTQSFAALDGSSSDHDGTANGIFTVSDGNLVVNGTVNCNDDVGTNACAMAFAVSGNMTVSSGGALYAENRSGGGNGGAITLSVGGNLALNGAAIISAASRTNGSSDGGSITANVSGTVTLSSGTTLDAGAPNGQAGPIAVIAGGIVTANGNIYSGSSRTLLATRLTGAALDGGNGNQTGGAISISSSTFAEPAIVVGASANIVSQGEKNGAGPVTIDGCGVEIRGLVAALSHKDEPVHVSIRSGKAVLIDGSDLGGAGTRMGRVRADSLQDGATDNSVDVFASDNVQVLGPSSAGTLFTISTIPVAKANKDGAGTIRVVSTGGTVSSAGRSFLAGVDDKATRGGTVSIAAAGNVNLDGATLVAIGDYSKPKKQSAGGHIIVRSHGGSLLWRNGTGDVRPVGSDADVPPADQGTIHLTACGTIDTTGSTFPTNGVPTGVFPQTQSGVCSPSAPSLPIGVPPLITCNTPPVANDATASTNEDTTVTITLSGSDADGDSLTFTIVSGPSNGTLGPIVPTGPTSATVNYSPALNYFGGDSFVYRANDGNGGTDDATVTITIAPVNDPPTFLAGPTAVALEDSGPQSYPNWATGITPGPANESGQNVTFTVTNDNPSLFSVQPAVAPNGTLTYTPAPNQYGTANLTVTAHDNGGTANGGIDTSAPQTSSINITPVNDEPSFSAGPSQSVNEDAGPQTVVNWATSISPGPNEGSQTVAFTVTNNNNALFSAQPAVSPSGTLTYTPAANANGSATVTVFLTDNGGTANGGDDTSPSQTFTITVGAVNDAPSFTGGGDVTVLEDSGSYSAAWATAISAGPADESGQTLTFSVSNDNNGLFSTQPAIAPNGTLTFVVAANAFGGANVTVTLSDNGGTANGGSDTSAPQTFVIHVTAVNDEPSFTAGGNVTVLEDSGSYSAAWASSISAGPNESGQTLTFVATNDNNALFSTQPSVSPSGVLTFVPAANAFGSATVTVYLQDDGGTANGGDDTSPSVTFTITVDPVNDAPSFTSGGNVTVLEDSGAYSASWATGISAGPTNESGQSVAFNIVSNSNAPLFAVAPSIAPDGTLSFTPAANAFGTATITVNLQDNGGTANGGADTSANVSFTITIDAVNDAPSFTPGGNVTVVEDSGAYSAPWASGISAGPNEGGQTVSFNVSNDNNGLFSVQPSVSPAGVLSFTTAPNAFGTATVTVSLSDNGGTANGGVDTSAPVTFTITITGVNDPPTAGADSWEILGNTEVRVDLGAGTTPAVYDTTTSGTGVLDNDADTVEGDPFTITSIVGCPDTTAPFDCTFGSGAKLSMQANGSFTFTPGPGTTSASFQYVVTDQPAAGIPASATGTVTFTLYDMIWYVNGGAAAGGNGTSIAPFNALAPISGVGDADGPGDYLFVHNSVLSGNVVLEQAQRLWGEGIGLIIPRNLNGNGGPTVLVVPGPRPQILAAGSNTVTVNGVSATEVAGLDLSSSGGNAIDVETVVAGPAAGVSIYSNVVSGAAMSGVNVVGRSVNGTSASIDTTSITSTGNGVNVDGIAGPTAVSYTNGTIVSLGGIGIRTNGLPGSTLKVTGLSNVSISGNTAADGIVMSGTQFDANASTAAFETVNAANVTVGASGNPVGATGITASGMSGDVAFSALTVFGGTSGVSIGGTGLFTGATGMRLTGTGGAISAAAGVGLSVSNATIGAANLGFTSIAANGGLNGIVLNNTDTVGGLVVSGTGVADSGGILQNAVEDGIRLTSTVNPSFSWMRIQNTGASGVRGTGVVNFTFANGAITGSGNAVGESNITFTDNAGGSNISGNLSLTNSTLTTAFDHGLRVRNASGTLTNVTVTGNTFTSTTTTATSKGSAVNIELVGTAATVANLTKATVANNSISNFPSGAGIKVLGGNANAAGPAATVGASAIDVVSITNNQVAGLSTAVRLGTTAIEATVSGRGSGNFDITNNGTAGSPLRNMTGTGITLAAFGNASVSGTIANNVIVANNALGSAGISTGADALFGFTDTPSINATVNGNSVSNTSGNGILAGVRNSFGIGKFTITNNIVGAPTASVRPGIRVDSGTGAGGNASLCLQLTGNTTGGSGGSPGIGLRKEGVNPAVNVFGIVGMSATSSPGVEQYVDSLNSSVPAPFGDGDGVSLLSATSGFTNCSLP
jgi:hypothetical protein